MATTATTARDQLLRDGYYRFEGVLPGEMLDRLRAVTDALLEAQSAEHRERYRTQGSMIAATGDPVLADLVTWPAALGALAELGFGAPTFSDGWVISKPPHSPRLFWHYDWFSWEDPVSYAPEPAQIFLMYYLTDTSPGNGCLRVMPGSHVRHTPLHDELLAPHSEALSQAEDAENSAFRTQPGERDVPVNAGDLLVGDARLLHAAHGNGSDHRRTLITLWYQPDLAALPERIQAQLAAKTQRIPDWWPAEARDRLAPMMTRYDGDAAPYPRSLWRPNPNAAR